METGWTSAVVPFGADQTVYVVIDNYGQDSTRHEIEIERDDLETIIVDLMAGKFNDPVRVIAFNTLEHWSKDLSKDIVREVEVRSDINGTPVPDHLLDFCERHRVRPSLAADAESAVSQNDLAVSH